jgi:hypothetical protein
MEHQWFPNGFQPTNQPTNGKPTNAKPTNQPTTQWFPSGFPENDYAIEMDEI